MQHTLRPRGTSAETACRLEASAPKPGNVHPSADFPDLSHAELLAAAAAIAPAVDRAHERPLGHTILDAVEASRAVTRSNANLGIILAIAPLAAVPDGVRPDGGVEDVLAATTAEDARLVWYAMAVARPGNLGSSARHDLLGPPPGHLLEAMREAAGRDGIARLWATGYRELFEEAVPELSRLLDRGLDRDEAIVRAYLGILARHPDTLVARKHGDDVARSVSAMAADLRAREGRSWHDGVAAFDAFLRSPPRKNPGTTADLVAATLFILVREGALE